MSLKNNVTRYIVVAFGTHIAECDVLRLTVAHIAVLFYLFLNFYLPISLWYSTFTIWVHVNSTSHLSDPKARRAFGNDNRLKHNSSVHKMAMFHCWSFRNSWRHGQRWRSFIAVFTSFSCNCRCWNTSVTVWVETLIHLLDYLYWITFFMVRFQLGYKHSSIVSRYMSMGRLKCNALHSYLPYTFVSRFIYTDPFISLL